MIIRVHRKAGGHMFELWVDGRLKGSHGNTTIWDAVGAVVRKKAFRSAITIEYFDGNTPTGRAAAEADHAELLKYWSE
jgi:hypothetical protein